MKRTTKSIARCAALAVLVGSLWAVTMRPGRELSLLRQDISAMLTLHQLHRVYPEATKFHVEYLQDG